jgi:hypothetical protein
MVSALIQTYLNLAPGSCGQSDKSHEPVGRRAVCTGDARDAPRPVTRPAAELARPARLETQSPILSRERPQTQAPWHAKFEASCTSGMVTALSLIRIVASFTVSFYRDAGRSRARRP